GGSATNDGGAGMARALGARFLDAAGRELPPGGAALSGLDRIDVSGLDPRLAETEIIGATDVTSPLLGPAGASAVFGAQKGASPEDVRRLEAALTRHADVLEKQLREDWPLPVKGLIAADSPEPEQSKTAAGPDLRHVPGAGAAGGLRSEERRVGKGGRPWWSRRQYEEKQLIEDAKTSRTLMGTLMFLP